MEYYYKLNDYFVRKIPGEDKGFGQREPWVVLTNILCVLCTTKYSAVRICINSGFLPSRLEFIDADNSIAHQVYTGSRIIETAHRALLVTKKQYTDGETTHRIGEISILDEPYIINVVHGFGKFNESLPSSHFLYSLINGESKSFPEYESVLISVKKREEIPACHAGGTD